MRHWSYREQPKYLRVIQGILLTLIVIGLGLLATQKYWVPKLVDRILVSEGYSVKDLGQSPAHK